jgi:hypothetical protein
MQDFGPGNSNAAQDRYFLHIKQESARVFLVQVMNSVAEICFTPFTAEAFEMLMLCMTDYSIFSYSVPYQRA